MSELLECLASSIPAAAEAAEKQKGCVTKIEDRLRETELFSASHVHDYRVSHDDTSRAPQISLPVDFFEAPWPGFYAHGLDQP